MAKYIIEIDAENRMAGMENRDFYISNGQVFFCDEYIAGMTPYEEPEQEKPKRWRANKDETYWCINMLGDVINDADSFWPGDNWRYQSGNYFRTKEEAEDYKESLIVYNELKAYAEPDDAWNDKTYHYCIVWDCLEDEMAIDFSLTCKHETLYFSTEEAARAAIEAVGEYRVKRFYLGIKED